MGKLRRFQFHVDAGRITGRDRGGDHDRAEREADLALAADPDHAMARIVRAGVAVQRGRSAAALEVLRPVLTRRDDLAAAHVVHGEALAGLGRLEDAAAAFARAVELEPGAAYLRRRLDEVRRKLAGGAAR